MVIGMILDQGFPPDPRVENEAVTLVRAGHTVHLFSLDFDHKRKQTEEVNGIQVYRARVPKHLFSFAALAYTLPYYHMSLVRKIKKFITDTGVEALHVHDVMIARSVFWANKEFKLPLTLDLHENRPEIMKHYAHVNSGWGKLLISPARWRKFEFAYMKRADKVIVVTPEAKDHYVAEASLDPNKFFVVPNTIRPEFYESYTRDENIISRYKDTFNLLYLGNTGLRRGLLTSFEALKHIIPVIPQIKIIVVGKSSEDHILKEFVDRHQYHKYVDFEGWQDVGLFQSYLEASHAGISPLHRNLHHDTTYANKIFQYLALGKPIIVSDCPSQANIAKNYNCGLVFLDRNVEDFAEKVISMYKDTAAYETFSKNAVSAIKDHLNWNILSEEILKLYEKE